jgi:FMN-dependent NADH-azoreductase
MAKLLHIESSPRKDRSASIEAARAFLDAYRAAHPRDEIETWDLWASELPSVDGELLNAKYAILHGQAHTPAQKAAWGAVVRTFQRFHSAQKYLFSLPMWNFGIPYRLKHFIDVITQPGLAFSFSPESGYKGLVTGRPAAVVYARGGEYSSGPGAEAMDFQKHYLEALLRFIGFTEIQSVVVEPTLASPESVKKTRQEAAARAKEIARTF